MTYCYYFLLFPISCFLDGSWLSHSLYFISSHYASRIDIYCNQGYASFYLDICFVPEALVSWNSFWISSTVTKDLQLSTDKHIFCFKETRLKLLLNLYQVMQECKEIYENSLVDGNPQKTGFVFGKVKCLQAPKGIWRKLAQWSRFCKFYICL